MPKKRKSDASRLDEVDRGMYTAFCGAANSLSQLYSQAMQQQRLSFQTGERHSMEKLYNWILRQQEDGVKVMPADIVAYIQFEADLIEMPQLADPIRLENELNVEEPPSSSRPPFQQQQQSQTGAHSTHSGISVCSNAFGPANVGQAPRSGNSDQTKNSIFSSALSSPVRRSLQNYHLSQGGNYARSNENNGNQIRDPNPPSSNDTSMDMHADSPGHDSPY